MKQHVRVGKLVIIGDSGVGKSSIIRRYILGYDTYNMQPTIGGAYHIITIDDVKFDIWDTAGQERFRSLCPMYYRNSSGCLCVFDVTDRTSFNNVDMWIELFKLHTNIPDPKVLLLANKIDLPQSQWAVSLEDIDAKAKYYECKYLLTSARQGTNIKEFIDYIKSECLSNITFDTPIETININKKSNSSKIINYCNYGC